jgi:hypothetical protein
MADAAAEMDAAREMGEDNLDELLRQEIACKKARKKELETKLTVVLWEDGKEPTEDQMNDWEQELRGIELGMDGKTNIAKRL